MYFRLKTPGHLRILAVGGEKCDQEMRKMLSSLLELGVSVYHMYGLTEMSVWQTMTRLNQEIIDTMPVYIPHSNLLSGELKNTI